MNRILLAGFTLLLAPLTNGCLHSNIEENWGKSHDAQVVWQTADQSAPVDREPREGMDPETAQRVAERYYEGQEKQEQRKLPSVVISDEL
jgi:hypothetical protein